MDQRNRSTTKAKSKTKKPKAAKRVALKKGRPTLYKAAFADALIEHFESYLREPYTREVIERHTITKRGGGVEVIEKYRLVAKEFPTLFSFSRTIKVGYWSLHHWATAKVGEAPVDGEDDTRDFLYPDFSQAYKLREHYQTQYLSRVGLGGIAPPAAFVFTAKNVLKWRDSIDQRFLGKDGEAMTPSYIVLPARIGEEELFAAKSLE